MSTLLVPADGGWLPPGSRAVWPGKTERPLPPWSLWGCQPSSIVFTVVWIQPLGGYLSIISYGPFCDPFLFFPFFCLELGRNGWGCISHLEAMKETQKSQPWFPWALDISNWLLQKSLYEKIYPYGFKHPNWVFETQNQTQFLTDVKGFPDKMTCKLRLEELWSY